MKIKIQSVLKTKYSIGDKLILIKDSWSSRASLIEGVIIKNIKITFMENMDINSLKDNVFKSDDVYITYTTNGNLTFTQRGDTLSFQGVGNNIFTNLKDATDTMYQTLTRYIGYSEDAISKNKKTIKDLQDRINKR